MIRLSSSHVVLMIQVTDIPQGLETSTWPVLMKTAVEVLDEVFMEHFRRQTVSCLQQVTSQRPESLW